MLHSDEWPQCNSASNSSIAAKLLMLSGWATAFASAFVNVYAVCSSFQKVEMGFPKSLEVCSCHVAQDFYTEVGAVLVVLGLRTTQV